MPRYAANLTTLFGEHPFLERFGAARAAAFEGVEFLFPYAVEAERIAAALARHRLAMVLFNLPPGDWDAGERGIACLPDRVGQFQDSVALALDYAQALGARQLHCMAGIVSADLPRRQAHATYVANLRFAAEQCRARGIRLLIEPINRYDMPGYFLRSSSQAVEIIRECASDNLFLQYDIYHMQRMEGELANTIARHLPLIKHMQLADTPGRHEPGSGEINYRYLLAHIDALGYEGWIGCEYLPLHDTVSGLAWRDALS